MATDAKSTGGSALEPFSKPVRRWFEASFADPTPAQALGWPTIASGAHTLICAPTGSGKTLAAFLWGIDRLARRADAPADADDSLGSGVRIVYVSPLKALSYDIERNLRAPLKGVGVDISVGLRTGDTPQRERQAMRRKPPDILITTPESLYLMMTSGVREILTGVEAVIVDEIHAVAQSKRGAHLALTLERLSHSVTSNEGSDPQRIGLSATQRPLERVANFLVGPRRQCEIADAGKRKELDLEIVVPVEDMTEPDASIEKRRDGGDSGFPPGDANFDAAPTNRSIWPAIYPELLKLVREHTSTIIFVNNRRGAERLAKRLNELANEDTEQELPATEHSGNGASSQAEAPIEVARAHHGSLAHEERLVVEELLKSGQLPCLVATSSLELGIDMGAVDLVIQVESPKSVARGLQRIGRAGHSLGEVSRGRIFPKFRADLLEAAVIAQRMQEGAIEETVIARNPLDVLAQQIVAICADQEIAVDELHELARGAYPFADLPRTQLDNVLDMLAGRYPSDEFAELRPRIIWDRTAGVIRGRPGAGRLAVTNAGTIPDRGLYGVHLVDGGGRVGELDEEMVYEARAGQTFLLGASTWRIEEITRDRVLVSPAPGVPGAVPFWKGEGVGRPYELGRAIGEFSRKTAATATPETEISGLDERATQNLLQFLHDQQAATGAVPSDKTVVVERFRDEIGDWRVCILTPFGARVHAPWALAAAARLREALGIEVQSIWSDDGIAFHLPDADAPPATDDLLLAPDELEDLVVQEVGQSALFGARFRENAARALLIPRRRPGERTPLWQQRLKAQSLLQVARRYPAFPIVLETYRECLRDVFDLPSLKQLLQGLRTRELDLVDVETSNASPYASSLLFDYIATYMYEDDTPPAERRAQALSLDRDLLRELLGQEELRDLLDPDAVAEVERSLRPEPRNPDELHDLLRLRGDLRPGEFDEAHGAVLETERRAFRARIGEDERLIAAEDAGRYRDALGVMPPSGLPEVFLEPTEEPLRTLVLRYARGRGPFTTRDANAHFGRDVESELQALERKEQLVRGELRPGGTEREWCEPDVLRRLRRASLAALRREVEPAEQAALGRFLPAWHGIDRTASLREALVPLQGLPLPVSLWEAEVLPRRVRGYQAAQLDQLCASGEVVWVGAGLDRVAVYFREDAAALGAPAAAAPPEGEAHDRIRETLSRSAEFWFDLLSAAELDAETALPALWELVWSGEVTNDAWTPLRAGRRYATQERQRVRPRRFSRHRSANVTSTQGRWSLASRLFPARPERRALAELLLERQGIVTRDGVRGEGIAGGYSAVYGQLRDLETLGICRRGYFVEGLGGAQFALPGAVERLRELRPQEDEEPDVLVLAAADPAQPYGAALPWPKRSGARAARVAGAHVVLLGGEAALFVERGGRSLVPLREPDEAWLRPALSALVDHVKRGGAKRLAVERFDGSPVGETEVMPLLLEAGFLAGPRRAVLRP